MITVYDWVKPARKPIRRYEAIEYSSERCVFIWNLKTWSLSFKKPLKIEDFNRFSKDRDYLSFTETIIYNGKQRCKKKTFAIYQR